MITFRQFIEQDTITDLKGYVGAELGISPEDWDKAIETNGELILSPGVDLGNGILGADNIPIQVCPGVPHKEIDGQEYMLVNVRFDLANPEKMLLKGKKYSKHPNPEPKKAWVSVPKEMGKGFEQPGGMGMPPPPGGGLF